MYGDIHKIEIYTKNRGSMKNTDGQGGDSKNFFLII